MWCLSLLSDRRVDLEIRKVAKDSGSETTSELPNSHEERFWSGEWCLLMLQKHESHLTLTSETNRRTLAHKAMSFTNPNLIFQGHKIWCSNLIVVGLGGGWGQAAHCYRRGTRVNSLFPQIASHLGGEKKTWTSHEPSEPYIEGPLIWPLPTPAGPSCMGLAIIIAVATLASVPSVPSNQDWDRWTVARVCKSCRCIGSCEKYFWVSEFASAPTISIQRCQ